MGIHDVLSFCPRRSLNRFATLSHKVLFLNRPEFLERSYAVKQPRFPLDGPVTIAPRRPGQVTEILAKRKPES